MTRETKELRKKKRKKKHRFLKFLLFLIIILAVLAGGLYFYMDSKISKMDHQDVSVSELGISDDVASQLDGYTNIAVLGVDSRDMDDIEGSRADTIVVMSVNDKTGDINLVSVFRDTMMDQEEYGLDKVTHSFAYGGPQQTLRVLNRNLDLNIENYVAMNFKTVATMVDSVGGITIDVKENEIQDMNQYIPSTAKNVGADSYELIQGPGKQTLDGVQAVTYSRIRKTSGNDYMRASRTRDVMSAVLRKAKKGGVFQLNKTIDQAAPLMSTNMETKDVLPLMRAFISLNMEESIGYPYDKAGWIGKAWYCVPVTAESNVSRLHEEVFGQTGYSPSQGVVDISNSILNTTGCYYPDPE